MVSRFTRETKRSTIVYQIVVVSTECVRVSFAIECNVVWWPSILYSSYLLQISWKYILLLRIALHSACAVCEWLNVNSLYSLFVPIARHIIYSKLLMNECAAREIWFRLCKVCIVCPDRESVVLWAHFIAPHFHHIQTMHNYYTASAVAGMPPATYNVPKTPIQLKSWKSHCANE